MSQASGPLHHRYVDLTGRRFGRLVAIAYAPGHKRVTWLCRCDCGTEASIQKEVLLRGDTRSCGCLRRELAETKNLSHGHARKGRISSEFRSWTHIIERCENRQNADWPSYGGRGISVHASWRESFASFLADVGPKPNHHYSIDRIDNDGNYEPGNVRWATAKDQARNRRPWGTGQARRNFA